MTNYESNTPHIITFPNGVPGFEHCRQFELTQVERDLPFYDLQETEGEITLLLTNPFLLFPDYKLDLSSEVLQEVQATNAEDVYIFTIITMGETLAQSTVNLLAPIIINMNQKCGKQHILHQSSYISKQPFPVELPHGGVK
ncbi:flagellar assembly protein FliW [Longirhabdus pacifica]|uniref:flagellar assembly protein FliW n=1 Tax=Longirhabdus pacifica TaxID=2305227 RepID=UPI001009318A|nr:flagellar assembly protein FliW [Longirhabdus pacifica]